ncbi:phage portal protein [Phaeobacter sp. NW0010-22]|uniref:phage portal protein n=1 Tax=Phaeobacter sp. NW0010-22 TaxID=3135907 RepID=UPI003108905A
MKLWNLMRRPFASVQSKTSESATSPEELERALRAAGSTSNAGVSVTPHSALRASAVFACVRIISGAVANLPIHVNRRVDEKVREDANDHPLWRVLRRKPNRWQTPSQFRRMLQAHLLLRGNAYAMIVRSRGRVLELVPLNPDRMECKQADDLSLNYTYTTKSGKKTRFTQSEIFHLVGLSLDGVNGVSVISYARETIGLSLAQEAHGAKTFKNAARPSLVLKHPKALGNEGREFLQASLDSYRSGGDSEGKTLILEEGMEASPLSMTAQDAQWLESRKFSRTDIAMFFGVPPHMIGETEKSTSWGSGIEQQSIGFVTYTLEDHLTTWEESANRDLIEDDDLYVRFNRKALVRGDIKTRTGHYTSMMQWGVYSPNDVRAYEDENPREGGDVYYDPPNTAGTPNGQKEDSNDTA